MLGTADTAGKLSIVGAPEALMLANAGTGSMLESSVNGTMGLAPNGRAATVLPKGFSGFVSGGFTTNGATLDGGRAGFRAGQRSWHVGMGLEIAVSEAFTLGTAFGYADGYSMQGDVGDRAETRSSQMAVYGSYKLGNGFYVGGIAAAEMGRASFERQASSGEAVFDLTGATESRRYTASAEAGVNLGIGRGLTLTPRVGVGYSSYSLAGYRENGGDLALQLDDVTVRQLNGRIGAKLAGTTRLGVWTLIPQLQADYVQNLSGSGNGMEVRFAEAGGYAFTLPIGQGDTSWAEMKGGFKLTNGVVEFGGGVETSLGRSNYRDDRATADFTFRF
jgi:outer membrane autotransporter protein